MSNRPRTGLREAVVAVFHHDRIVGLRYRTGETPIPVVVCKGSGAAGMAMLDEVRQLGIPIVDNDALVAAIRALPARQREVIVLRVFFDLGTEATASLLGISPGTVGVHLHRALGTLRTQIPSFLDEGVTR